MNERKVASKDGACWHPEIKHLSRPHERLFSAVAGDFPAMWAALQSRLFYCFLLASGIWVSMRREQRKDKMPRTVWRRVAAIFGVWAGRPDAPSALTKSLAASRRPAP